MPREVQILPSGKTGDCLLTGTQAILVCFVSLGRLDKGTPLPFTSHGDVPEVVDFSGNSRSWNLIGFFFTFPLISLLPTQKERIHCLSFSVRTLLGSLGDRADVGIWFPLSVTPGLGVSGAQADPVWTPNGWDPWETRGCKAGGWRCGPTCRTPHLNPIHPCAPPPQGSLGQPK